MARFIITLEAADDRNPPPIVRLRRLLKGCLRIYGLRAVEVREEKSNKELPREILDAAANVDEINFPNSNCQTLKKEAS